VALSANIPGAQLNARLGAIQGYSVGAGVQIHRGALCVLRLVDGYLYPAVDDTADAYKQLFVGYAYEAKDNSNGSAGAVTCRVRRDGQLALPLAGVGQADIGQLACIKDDEQVQLYGASSTKVVVGRIREVKVAVTSAWVDLEDRPLRLATSAYD